jgi:hypothetical protein
MSTRSRWVYFIAAAPMLALAADSMDVRPGLWQMSMTVQSQGSMIPQSALDQMPKERRDQVMAQMAARAGPHTTTSKSCVTAEEIRKGAFSDIGADDHGNCKLTITSGTKTLQEGTQVCTGDSPRTSHIRMEMLGREQLKGTMETATPNGKVTVQMAGKWMAATCTKDDER